MLPASCSHCCQALDMYDTATHPFCPQCGCAIPVASQET